MLRLTAARTAVLVCLLAPACSGRAASRPEGEAPRRVQVVKAERRRIPRTVVAVGTLAAEERADLGFKVPGRLAVWNVDLGSRVAEGASLVELDARDYELRRDRSRAALEQARARLGLAVGGNDDDVESQAVGIVRQAKARLDQASVNLNRSRELRDQGILAQADFDAGEAAFKVAQSLYNDALEEVSNRRGILAERRSDLALAEQQLLDTKLRAPFSGAVQQRRSNLGEYLAAGAPVLTLVKLTPLRLRLDVPEREAPNVRKGQDVAVRVEGDTNAWPGRIVRVSPALEESNRSLIAEAEVDNSKGLLRPGSFARAEIVTDSGQDSLVVPGSSVLVFAGIEKVITVKEGKAFEQPVTTGRRTGDSVEVLAGLSDGAAVVVKPGSLQTGVAVEISSGPTPAP
ncbi:MAG TPA: efflux RND transporter periplasmic adaptor subunit [Vicinamibacteria bacterium]|nr:efflux RND transporter periplasmic adaptor subunit [Vicinamibacteria bacterium]